MRYQLGLAVVTVYLTPLSAGDAGGIVSRVFVYSQRETPARSWTPIVCDGKTVADVKRGVFFAVNVGPGRHSLWIADGVPVTVEVLSGAEVFVRLDWDYDVRRSPIPVLNTVAGERAKKEMRFLRYVDTKRIHSTTVPGSDPRPAENPKLRSRE